jgi:dTMP kinase
MNFVVIEGLDGSGKSTQIDLLKKHLENISKPFKFVHFPRTGSRIYGEMIAKFLRGEFGELNEVNPYLVALLYAGDRNDAAEMINSWLDEGIFVLMDRYVYSNVAFQCAKLGRPDEQEKLRKWIHHLEFEYHNIPKPDISLFLDVPFDFTVRKLTSSRTGDDRNYLKGKKDIHEASIQFQQKVRKVYLWQVEKEPDFHLIDCKNENNDMMKPDDIFKRIIDKIDLK